MGGKEDEAPIPPTMSVMVVFTTDKKADWCVQRSRNEPLCPYVQVWQSATENTDLKNS